MPLSAGVPIGLFISLVGGVMLFATSRKKLAAVILAVNSSM
jgi:hypothetical protein